MAFTVYILFSEKFNKHYTGYTSDILSRFQSHNKFGKDWTSHYRPWKIIYKKEFDDKVEAMTYEKWLKTGPGGNFQQYFEGSFLFSLYAFEIEYTNSMKLFTFMVRYSCLSTLKSIPLGLLPGYFR